jgi:serine protease
MVCLNRADSMPSRWYGFVTLALALLMLTAGGVAQAQVDVGRSQRVIVRFTDTAVPKSLSPVARELRQQERIAAVGAATRSTLMRLRETGDGALVLALPEALPIADVADLALRLQASPDVAWAEADRRVRPMALDPWRGAQWNLRAPDSASPVVGGINAEAAWSRHIGQGAAVAVIDSGKTDHPDLAGAWLGGYDMIAGDTAEGLAIAGDGDGRDPDPSDPGNWCETGAGASTWHGTAVAGIIAARMDNGYGIAGVAPASAILPVRAIGRCGGYMSDVLDAMRWSVGLGVAGLPANPTPVRVLNISLGGAVGSACSAYEQATVDAVVAAGGVVLAAAGNDATADLASPANCRGVLAIAAHTRSGDLAPYSNFHPGIVLTAPGGTGGSESSSILTSGNDGTNGPGNALQVRAFTGTSAAVPHVAAVAAMLIAIDPSLNADAVRSALVSSARPWPAGSRCARGDAVGQCGAGMLDASRALASLDHSLSVQIAGPVASVPGGSDVTLTAAAVSGRHGNGTLRYQWSQRSGATVTLQGADQASVRLIVPAVRSRIGLRVTATDPEGRVAVADTVVEVNNLPVVTSIGTVNLAVGDSYSDQLIAQDPDGDALTYVLLEGPPGLGISRDEGLIYWAAATEGVHPVRIRVADSSGLAAPELAFEIRVGYQNTTTLPFSMTSQGGGGALPWWLVAVAVLCVLGVRQTRSAGRMPRR